MKPLRALCAMTAVVLMVFAVSTQYVTAEDPPQYLVTRIENNLGESFRPNDINEAGVVVGGDGFLYTDFAGMHNLNDLGATWFDLDSGILTTAWTASSAKGINDSDPPQIVGTASHIAGVEADRVFVLNDPLGAPEFILLPRFAGAGNSGAAINDFGVVVGEGAGETIVFDPIATTNYSPVGIPVSTEPQEINNLGIIVTRSLFGEGYVISPDPDTGSYEIGVIVEFFQGDELYGINDSNMISGHREPITGGRPNQRRDGGAFSFQYDPTDPGRRPGDADLLNTIYPNLQAYFCDINELGHVAFGNRGFIYLEEQNDPGPFELIQHVEFDSPEDETAWMASALTQPNGINDNGQIIVRGDSGTGFLLTLIVPGPGISVSPTSGLVTTEAGGTDTFNVRLDSAPSGAVTVSVNSLDPTEGITNVISLTFDQSDWSVDKLVTVTGVQDSEYDPDNTYYIEVANASSTVQVEVTNVGDDDDMPPGGGTYDFPVPLESLPMSIPDRSTVLSTIVVPVTDDFQIANMTVNLDIWHERPSDLRVTLIGPGGVEAPLSNFTGDNNVTAFNDDWTADTMWILEIRDVKKKQIGTLDGWSITVETQ